MKKVNNYFSHDFNARNDIKLKKLNMQLGLQGIGLYWCIIECLYENDGYLTLDEDVDLLVYDLKVDRELIINLIDNFDLFKKNKNKFYSQSVLDRLQKITDKSNKNRESVSKRWEKQRNKQDTNEDVLKYEKDTNVLPNIYECNTNVLPKENECNTTEIQTKYQIKEKKKEKKKIKENKIKKNKLLTTTTNNNSNLNDSIYSFIENSFSRLLSSMEIQKIREWLEALNNQEDILRYAVYIAVMNNVPTFAYVDGILKNWKSKGLTTLEQIKQNDKKITTNEPKKLDAEKDKLLNELSNYNWFEE